MIIQPAKDKLLPHLVVDDFYDKYLLEGVWKELDFYSHTQMQSVHENTTAIIDGKFVGDKMSIPMIDVYTQSGATRSLIFKATELFKHKDIHDGLKEAFSESPYDLYRYFSITNYSDTLISYYEDKHYYKPHIDSSHFTILIWLYKTPKNFFGGNLNLYTKQNEREPYSSIEIKNNRMVIIPSFYSHGVDELKVIDDSRKDKWGRYAITHFLGYDEKRRQNQ
jgi:Rps23 Pro-64 3,4-dihydroxylase Tpa1-like proline 4-hydroxylase